MPVPRNNPRRAEFVKVAQTMHAAGSSYEEIAEQLDVAPKTVKNYLSDPTGKRTVAINRRSYRRKLGKRNKKEAEVEFNRMDLPISTKITMRPAWQRRQRRIYGQNKLAPPTEEEKADAIKILGDKHLEEFAPALWFEAFLIFDEASK